MRVQAQRTRESFCSASMAPLILSLILLLAAAAAAAAGPQLAGCPDKCGNMSIPYPFGIGKPGCFRDGFEVICNTSFNPPRAFLSNYDLLYNKTATWPYRGVYQEMTEVAYLSGGAAVSTARKNLSFSLLELVRISVADSQATAYGAVASDCTSNYTVDHTFKLQTTVLDGRLSGPSFPFLLSAARNVLVGVGRNVQPLLANTMDDRSGFWTSCLSYSMGFLLVPADGVCSGRGCCESDVPADAPPRNTFSVSFNLRNNTEREDYPCNYGMVAEKSWYTFATPDSEKTGGYEALSKRFSRGVPFVVDFAIRNGGACPPANGQQTPPDYACASGNSYCANATAGAQGYVCKCSQHYDGNPYIPNGCQDIDECQLRKQSSELGKLYPCSSDGVCKNRDGGYDCPCKRGMKGDGKEGTCTDIFPLGAKLAVGFAAIIVVIVLMVLAHQLRKLKRFYEQNGGPLLNGVKNIKIYSSAHMKRISSNYKDSIGQGHFGKVYLGILKDQQKVAIKKSIKVDEDRKKEFTDEIIIQSEMRQKNIVRLIGCCLEMDVPMLVYEFVARGSLYDVLFQQKGGIPVATRLGIAIGSAEGLAYMHSSGESTIRHGDVKSGNILLDENFTPKVSDFGTSKLLERGKNEKTELVVGDMSYIDPIYMEQGIITQKSDVYSFGIVLIELVTRRPATYDEKRSYVANFVRATVDKTAKKFIDNDITSVADIEVLEMMSEVAVECLKSNPEERLDMKQVDHRLHIIGQSSGVENPNLSSSPGLDAAA